MMTQWMELDMSISVAEWSVGECLCSEAVGLPQYVEWFAREDAAVGVG